MSPSARQGRRVGPFRLVDRLGGGRETEVWSADGPDGPVAVKLLRDGWDHTVAVRMAREVAALARLHDRRVVEHHEVVSVLEISDDPHDPWIAIKLVEGGTLDEHRRAGSLDLPMVLHALRGLASVLDRIHRAGVVHRDVKPSNVLIGRVGPVLADFAAATIDGTTFDGTLAGQQAVIGTPGYQAPEAGVTPPSPALDVFALGVAGAELLASVADAAPAGETIARVREWCIAARHPDPAQRPPLGELEGLTVRALDALGGAWVPRTRPASAARSAATATSPSNAELVDEVVEADTEHGPDGRIPARGLAAIERLRRDAVAASEPRAAVVFAEAGAGKTHLIDAALRRAAVDGWVTARIGCDRDDTPCDVLRGWVDALARATGQPTGAGDLGRLDDEAAAVEAIRQLLAACGPALLALDDLHRASAELVAVVEELSAIGPPFVLVLAGRPGRYVADDVGATAVMLAPIDDGALGLLARSELGRAPSDSELELVRAASAGHPLRARLVAAALARGLDVGTGQVEDLVARRCRGWDVVTRDAVALAAECGARFWPEALGADVIAATVRLLEEGLVEPVLRSRIAGSAEIGFVHDLVRAALSGPPELKAARHRALTTKLASAGAPATVVVGHAVAAVDGGAMDLAGVAARSARDAARFELDQWSPRSAGRYVAASRRMAAVGTGAIAPTVHLGELDVLEAEVARRRGDPSTALQLATRHTDLVSGEADPLAADAMRVCARAALDLGSAADAVAWGRRLVSVSAARPADRLELAVALVRSGAPGEALELADRLSDEAGDDVFRAEAATIAALAASDLAFVTLSPPIDAHRRAIAAWHQLRRVDRRAWTRRAADLVDAVFVTDWNLARSFAEEAHAVAEELGEDAARVALACFLGDLAIESDDPAAAARWLDEVGSARVEGRWTERARVLRTVLAAARTSGSADRAVPELLAIAERQAELDPELACLARREAVALLCWEGRPAAARGLDLTDAELEPLRPVIELLDGPPWPEPVDVAPGSVAALELGFRLALAGDDAASTRCLSDAMRARRESGLTYPNRVAVGTPVYLYPALAPSASDPPVDWFRTLFQAAALPGIWCVHRGLVGAVLARRGIGGFDTGALARVLAELPVEPSVRSWIADWLTRG